MIKIISTFFYVGYLPFIPGTFGSLAAIPLYLLLKDNIWIYLSVVLVLGVLGIYAAGKAEEVFNTTDPKYVVIDEVVGMLISFLFIPCELRFIIIGFFLFRLFDTLKPYPVGRLERMHGGIGIMGDDIMAGIYTNIVLQVVSRLVS